jgi:hypothetical protein
MRDCGIDGLSDCRIDGLEEALSFQPSAISRKGPPGSGGDLIAPDHPSGGCAR